ncbi:hypothetical protein GCK72_008412 [Caenorhabditis remanei]|uniref:Mitochondrial import inner membrane translocase subunit tim-16 n=3 Tax=Caenorhabditis remanei TaxID=31234 RepID=A0A6A5H078_CAERE|nr:hypothetical protein GCK72_008412 [Caenorhabditis remanei]KAF1760166.1 hypothetical protein GCK72_008412 [Caenorhabditis remanei]
MEIDEKFKFLKPESTVIDIGCAPGSWIQVVVEKCPNGYVLGVDLQNVLPIRGAEILSQSDVTSPEVHLKIREKLKNRELDVVLSDMAPNPTGDNATDHLRLIELCRTVFRLFSEENCIELKRNGVFLCKIWDGAARGDFIRELSERFATVKTVKPTACRDNSAEIPLPSKRMPWRTALKVVLAAGEAVTKALTRAVRDEIRQTQQAAARHATATGQTASETKENANANAKLGISLEESLQILNVKTPLNREDVEKNYEHLFAINDKTKGGTFYLQSKVFRAKERIDEELGRLEQKSEAKKEENAKNE